MNQIYPVMSASDPFLFLLGQTKVPRLLDLAIRVRDFLHLSRIQLGTGIIAGLNKRLRIAHLNLVRKQAKIIQNTQTEADFLRFRKDLFLPILKIHREISDWKEMSETKMIADDLLQYLYDLEFILRKKVYANAHPNRALDQPLKEAASKISLTSAASLSEKNVLSR